MFEKKKDKNYFYLFFIWRLWWTMELKLLLFHVYMLDHIKSVDAGLLQLGANIVCVLLNGHYFVQVTCVLSSPWECTDSHKTTYSARRLTYATLGMALVHQIQFFMLFIIFGKLCHNYFYIFLVIKPRDHRKPLVTNRPEDTCVEKLMIKWQMYM